MSTTKMSRRVQSDYLWNVIDLSRKSRKFRLSNDSKLYCLSITNAEKETRPKSPPGQVRRSLSRSIPISCQGIQHLQRTQQLHRRGVLPVPGQQSHPAGPASPPRTPPTVFSDHYSKQPIFDEQILN